MDESDSNSFTGKLAGIHSLFLTKSKEVFFLRSAKDDRYEMDGTDSDSFIRELAGIHHFGFNNGIVFFLRLA